MVPLLLFFIGCLSLNSAAFALGPKIEDEIAAYNQHNYAETIAIAKQLTGKNMFNATAHYYMACAYACMGQAQEALEEYSFCDKITNDPYIKNYCDRAIQLLMKEQSPNGHPTNVQVSQSSSSNFQSRQEMEDKIRQIHEDARRDIEDIPRFTPSPVNNRRIRNPEYQDLVQSIRQREMADIERVRHEYLSDSYEMPSYCNQARANYGQANEPNNYPSNYPYNSANNYAHRNPQNIPGAANEAYSLPPNYAQRVNYPNNNYVPPNYQSIPGYQPTKTAASDPALFNVHPLPPPPFPKSALKGAEKALEEKLNEKSD